MSDKARRVSYPVGEDAFTEYMIRTTYPDGTISDTEPERVGAPRVAFGDMVSGIIRSAEVGVTRQRFERKATTYVSPWAPVDPARPLVDTDAVAEALPREDLS